MISMNGKRSRNIERIERKMGKKMYTATECVIENSTAAIKWSKWFDQKQTLHVL